MATGKANQNTKQCGEYLVASELFRKGYINTTFTGNMPDFDIIAVNKKGNLKRIQVKTTTGYGFRLKLTKYVKIKFQDGSQIIEGKQKLENPDLINIFVKLADKPPLLYTKDEFYILTEEETQNLSHNKHKDFLDSHGGKRPRKPESLVHILKTDHLAPYQDKWDKLEG